MLALAHVMHFLADEFTRLRAGRLSFLLIFSSALDRLTFRHKGPPLAEASSSIGHPPSSGACIVVGNIPDAAK